MLTLHFKKTLRYLLLLLLFVFCTCELIYKFIIISCIIVNRGAYYLLKNSLANSNCYIFCNSEALTFKQL